MLEVPSGPVHAQANSSAGPASTPPARQVGVVAMGASSAWRPDGGVRCCPEAASYPASSRGVSWDVAECLAGRILGWGSAPRRGSVPRNAAAACRPSSAPPPRRRRDPRGSDDPPRRRGAAAEPPERVFRPADRPRRGTPRRRRRGIAASHPSTIRAAAAAAAAASPRSSAQHADPFVPEAQHRTSLSAAAAAATGPPGVALTASTAAAPRACSSGAAQLQLHEHLVLSDYGLKSRGAACYAPRAMPAAR